MATLQPPFYSEEYEQRFPGKFDWTVTAGSASQITDGAAALLIASREKAESLGLRPRARIHTDVVVGSDPVLQLTGPIPSTRKALATAGLSLKDIDVVEINEAFAAVVLAWKKELEIDDDWFEEHVNPNGGAIACGHPLGASGARIMTDLVNELERREARFGLQTMCAAFGTSNTTIIERLD
jgi:acetyl-CoA acetyltransferase family protein